MGQGVGWAGQGVGGRARAVSARFLLEAGCPGYTNRGTLAILGVFDKLSLKNLRGDLQAARAARTRAARCPHAGGLACRGGWFSAEPRGARVCQRTLNFRENQD